jgi:hypothetical protein
MWECFLAIQLHHLWKKIIIKQYKLW